ncbi:hypothetical protein [Sphingopyxis sp.]|uniref:hypothetical protein n=1 Tax=Sphingopyxis sp. TaxID=1908224 RepID=UPI0039C9B9F1
MIPGYSLHPGDAAMHEEGWRIPFLIAGAVAGSMALGLLCVPQLATISATFRTAVRFAGFAIAYDISTSIFGGTAPMIGSGVISLNDDPLMPAHYMMFACLVGLFALREDPFARSSSRPVNEG